MLDQISNRFSELSNEQVRHAEYGVWLSQAKLIDPIVCNFGHKNIATDIEVSHQGNEAKITYVCDQCKYEWENSLN